MAVKKLSDRKIAKIVVDNGQFYKPAVLPSDIPRGMPGQCFDWCALQAVKNRKYSYVEGLATDPDDQSSWILHAWLTDGVHAFDPTWGAFDDDGVEHPVPAQYLGFEMDTVKVAKFMKATGYQGIIANSWRNQELFKEIMA